MTAAFKLPAMCGRAGSLTWAGLPLTLLGLAVAPATNGQIQQDTPSVWSDWSPQGWSIGVMGAQAINVNFAEIIPKAVSAHLDRRPAYLHGIVARRRLSTPDWLATLGRQGGTPISHSVEVGIFTASGLASNTEFVLDWRPSIQPWQFGPWGVGFAWGIGFSHAAGTRWSEFTSATRPGGYRDLFHMAPEIVFTSTEAPQFSLSLRVHHSSGVYGLVAPRRVGSNHLALVAMHSF